MQENDDDGLIDTDDEKTSSSNSKKRKYARVSRFQGGNKSRKLNDNKSNVSPYKYVSIRRYNVFNVFLDSISNKINESIISQLRCNTRYSSNKFRYLPSPIITMTYKYVSKYISFDNCIILNNPEVDSKNEICYNRDPYFIGKNIDAINHDFKQTANGITVQNIQKKCIALVVEKESMLRICEQLSNSIVEIPIPEYEQHQNESSCEIPTNLRKNYALLMLTTNHKRKITKECRWTKLFCETLKKNLRKNVSNNGNGPAKHFESVGDYYGFGLTAKYNAKNNMSVYQFAGNENNNNDTKHILSVVSKDVDFTINRLSNQIPYCVYCGFCIWLSLLKILRQYKSSCGEILNEIDTAIGGSKDKLAISNWICHNAETRMFHQEFDISYTIISVPFYDYKDNNNGDTKGNNEYNKDRHVNFCFRWTSKNTPNNHDHRYVSIKMDDGVSIFYSAFTLYHKQVRFEKDDQFYNISSYQNKTFLAKMITSIIRYLKENETDLNQK